MVSLNLTAFRKGLICSAVPFYRRSFLFRADMALQLAVAFDCGVQRQKASSSNTLSSPSSKTFLKSSSLCFISDFLDS